MFSDDTAAQLSHLRIKDNKNSKEKSKKGEEKQQQHLLTKDELAVTVEYEDDYEEYDHFEDDFEDDDDDDEDDMEELEKERVLSSSPGSKARPGATKMDPLGFLASVSSSTTKSASAARPLPLAPKKKKDSPSSESASPKSPKSKSRPKHGLREPQKTSPSPELDDLQMLKVIGKGTFGTVQLVQQRQADMFYALKSMKKMDVVKLKQVDHINAERSILESLQHPFIVQLHKTFQDSERIYMLLEYVPGGELFTHLRSRKQLDSAATKFYSSEIVLALEYLHSLNVVYRDLKPENILIGMDGHVKLTDFGFAKRISGRTWSLCGTPEYLAPEIIQSKGHGFGVDWWALGILIFEMLAGHPPFYADSPFAIYEQILSCKISFPPHFEAQSKDLIKRLLIGDRTQRLGSLKNGADDIKRHKWYKGWNWIAAANKELSPPFIPKLSSAGDCSNFQAFDKVRVERPTGSGPDLFKSLFEGF